MHKSGLFGPNGDFGGRMDERTAGRTNWSDQCKQGTDGVEWHHTGCGVCSGGWSGRCPLSYSKELQMGSHMFDIPAWRGERGDLQENMLCSTGFNNRIRMVLCIVYIVS